MANTLIQSEPIRIRASSFGELFDCALRWKVKHLDGKRLPNSPRALLGTGVHAGTAVFDASRVDGGHAVSIDEAVGVALDAIKERVLLEGVRWTIGEPSAKEIDQLAIGVTSAYCEHVAPRYDFEAVELTTTPLELTHNGITIVLTGTLDRARIRAGGHGITDVKTGRAAVVKGQAATKKHRAQIGTYEVLYEHTTGNEITAPSEILAINTSGSFATAATDVVGAKRFVLGHAATNDKDAFGGLIDEATKIFKTGDFRGNPDSTLCDPRYCPNYARCPWVQ